MLDEAKNDFNHLTNTVQQTTKEHSASKADREQWELRLDGCLKASDEEKSLLKEASAKNTAMLDDAKQEINNLKDAMQHIEEEHARFKADWEEKKLQLMNHLKATEEEVSSMNQEVVRLRGSLKEVEDKAHAAHGESHSKSELMETRSVVTSLSEALETAQSEIVKSRDSLFDKENELQNLMQENHLLRASVEDADEDLDDEFQKTSYSITVQGVVEDNEQLSSSGGAGDGIVRFGQANSSMLSQLPTAGKVKKMLVHCLDGVNGGGIFAIGEVVQPKLNSTSLVPDQAHYNVIMKSIEEADDVIEPSTVTTSGSQSAVILDSGTTLAYLPDGVYDELMSKITAQQPGLSILTVEDTFKCFQYTKDIDDRVPAVELHFDNSLTMTLYPHEYLFEVRQEVWCFGWQNSGGTVKVEND